MDESDRYAALRSALSDRYEFRRELGRGGMATVYLVHDTRYGRDVALKVLRPELASLGPSRFLREMEIAARLNHPNILAFYEAGEAAGWLYYTMPNVEGESLRDRLRREGPLSVEAALRIADQVAAALAYAHDRGIVHRDIKPANILLQGDHALVSDFGIARAMAIADDERITQSGVSLGTPAYMSPEQTTDEQEADARSDIYSLGCVVYEMLAGDPPFTGSTAQVILARKLSQEPAALGTVRRTVPEPLERAVATALARTPADRFGDVTEFRDALHDSAVPTGLRGTFEELKRRRVIRAAIVYTVVAVGVVEGLDLFRAGLGLPGWTTDFMAGVAVFAFPLALVLAWVFELTPSGVRWTKPRRRAHRPQLGRAVMATRVASVGAVVVLAIVGSAVSWQRASTASVPAPARPALDPTRVAIIPFEVIQGDEELRRFAVNLTRRLIEGLSAIEALTVQSYGAVAPYAGGTIPLDSVARAIGAGTIVDGVLEESGDSVRVRIQLVDGETGQQIGGNAAESWFTERLHLVDAAADTITLLLRRALGPSIERRQRLLQTDNTEAFDALDLADGLIDEVHRMVDRRTNLDQAGDLAAQVDSLLDYAESLDPAWVEPVARRAQWTGHRIRLAIARGQSDVQGLLREGIGHADRALSMQPGHFAALEIRGGLRSDLAARIEPTDPDEANRLRDAAESDLRAAINGNPVPTRALRALSELYRSRGNPSEALAFGRRAWESDPFLDQAEIVLLRLFEYSFELGQDSDARRWCEEGGERFGDIPIFLECRLQLLAWTDFYPPSIDEAWDLVEKTFESYSPSLRPLLEPRLHMMVAAVIVRASRQADNPTALADSARALIRSARGDAPNAGVVAPWAAVLDMLGDREAALDAIRNYLAQHPEHASFFARRRELQPLRDDPEFRELIGERPVVGAP